MKTASDLWGRSGKLRLIKTQFDSVWSCFANFSLTEMNLLSWLSSYCLYCFDSECHFAVIVSFAFSCWLCQELPYLLFEVYGPFLDLNLPLTKHISPMRRLLKGNHYNTLCNVAVLIFPMFEALLQIDWSSCHGLPQSRRQSYTSHLWHPVMYLPSYNFSFSNLNIHFLCQIPCDTAS